MLIWHFHDDDVAGPPAGVELAMSHLADTGKPLLLQHFRIDRNHSNAYETWKRLGSPARPTPEQYDELERSSQLSLLSSPEWTGPGNSGADCSLFPAEAGCLADRAGWRGQVEIGGRSASRLKYGQIDFLE